MEKVVAQPDGFHIQVEVPCSVGGHPVEVLLNYNGALALFRNPCHELGEFRQMEEGDCDEAIRQLEEIWNSERTTFLAFGMPKCRSRNTEEKEFDLSLHRFPQRDERFWDDDCEDLIYPAGQAAHVIGQAVVRFLLDADVPAIPKVQRLSAAVRAPAENLIKTINAKPRSAFDRLVWALSMRRCFDDPEYARPLIGRFSRSVVKSLPRAVVSVFYADCYEDEQVAFEFLSHAARHAYRDIRRWACSEQVHRMLSKVPPPSLQSEGEGALDLWRREYGSEILHILESAGTYDRRTTDAACTLAVRLRLTDAVPALKNLWRCEELAQIGTPEASEALIELLGKRDSSVRSRARWALATIETEDVSLPLADALQKSDRPTKADLYLALGAVGGQHAASVLKDAVHQEKGAARYMACLALGATGDAGAMETIRTVAENSDQQFKQFAESILRVASELGERTRSRKGARVLEPQQPTEKEKGCPGTLPCPPELLREHVAALCDGNPDTRAAACKALGKIDHPIVLPALFEALHETCGDVVIAACNALARVGSPVATTEVLGLLHEAVEEEDTFFSGTLYTIDSDVAQAAYSAFLKLSEGGDPETDGDLFDLVFNGTGETYDTWCRDLDNPKRWVGLHLAQLDSAIAFSLGHLIAPDILYYDAHDSSEDQDDDEDYVDLSDYDIPYSDTLYDVFGYDDGIVGEDTSEYDEYIKEACKLYTMFGPSTIPSLIKLLRTEESGSEAQRIAAAAALAEIGEPLALPALIKTLPECGREEEEAVWSAICTIQSKYMRQAYLGSVG